MRILTRYLLRLHVAPFAFSLAALTLLLLLDQVSRHFEQLVGKGLHWTVIAQVFLYSIPFILAQTFPMAVLIAVLYTFNRLAGDHEITAMKASGIPLPRLLAPLVVAAVILAGGMTVFNNTILPESNHRLVILRTSIARKMPTFELREQTVNEVLPNRLYLQVARIDRQRSGLEDVVIYDERLPARSRTIYADSGHMASNPEQTDLYLTLHDGVVQEQMRNKPETFQRMYFGRLIMRVEDVTNQLELAGEGLWRSDREMTIGQMKEERRGADERAAQALRESFGYSLALTHALGRGRRLVPREVEEDTLISETAARLVGGHTEAGDIASRYGALSTQWRAGLAERNKYSVEIQKKFSIPAACIVFVLIGAPIAMRYPLGGVALVVAASFVVFCAYYVSLVGGEELADNLILSPFWAMWGPNVLFGGAGLALVWRARKAGR